MVTGKSSITLRLVRSQWTSEYDPTIGMLPCAYARRIWPHITNIPLEDSYSVTRTVDGVPYYLMLTDTAGQEEYRGLWAASNLQSDAFLLVYDITSANSLDALDYFMEMIEMETENRLDNGKIPPIKCVVGNKCDLQGQRVVEAKTGLEWARRRKCGFMETSAREMVNIEETFACKTPLSQLHCAKDNVRGRGIGIRLANVYQSTRTSRSRSTPAHCWRRSCESNCRSASSLEPEPRPK